MTDKREWLRDVIERDVLITKKQARIVGGAGRTHSWVFDFRSILLNSSVLNSVSNLFFETIDHSDSMQVGGLETAAIPLVAGIVMEGKTRGLSIDGFYIRKERKRHGLQKSIEGSVDGQKRIVLVDDLINNGWSLLYQIKLLEEMGLKVDTIFVLLQFRDKDAYPFLKERGVDLQTLFYLKDFDVTLPDITGPLEKTSGFELLWAIETSAPDLHSVKCKSTPVTNNELVFIMGDDGTLWALRQDNGLTVWTFQTHGAPKKKLGGYPSPTIFRDYIFIVAYNGDVFALKAASGEVQWEFKEADWGSFSSTLASDRDSLFVGLESGLFTKRGIVVSLDLNSGSKIWEYCLSEPLSTAPFYIKSKKCVLVFTTDKTVHALGAKTGKLLWTHSLPSTINASPAFCEKENLLLLCGDDGVLHCLNINSREEVFSYRAGGCLESSPVICNDVAYFTSHDKCLYALDLQTRLLKWRFATYGRVLSTPTVILDKVMFGSNDGRIYEVDAESGKLTDCFQTTERITSGITHNKKNGLYFILTFANELFCLRKKKA